MLNFVLLCILSYLLYRLVEAYLNLDKYEQEYNLHKETEKKCKKGIDFD